MYAIVFSVSALPRTFQRFTVGFVALLGGVFALLGGHFLGSCAHE